MQQTHLYHRFHQNLTMKSHPQQQEQAPHGPGAGKTAGNKTDDRQWLLLKGYPAIQDKNNNNDISSPKENARAETPIITEGPKKEKCGWGPDCPFCKVQEKKEENLQNRPLPNLQTQKLTKTKLQLLWKQRWRD